MATNGEAFGLMGRKSVTCLNLLCVIFPCNFSTEWCFLYWLHCGRQFYVFNVFTTPWEKTFPWRFWCITMYKPVCQEDPEVKVLFFVLLQSTPKTVHHLLPMRRLLMPAILLGEISLAAHYLGAVVQSVICYRVPLSTAYPPLMRRIKFIWFWLNPLKQNMNK